MEHLGKHNNEAVCTLLELIKPQVCSNSWSGKISDLSDRLDLLHSSNMFYYHLHNFLYMQSKLCYQETFKPI